MTEDISLTHQADPPEWAAHHPVARELGLEPSEDFLAYRAGDHLQPPGSEDETGFCDGGVV